MQALKGGVNMRQKQTTKDKDRGGRAGKRHSYGDVAEVLQAREQGAERTALGNER